MEFEKKKKKLQSLLFENISHGEIFRFVTYEKMNEMRIKESLSLSCIEEERFICCCWQGYLIFSFFSSQQAKEKESIDTMQCDALRDGLCQVVLINLVKY